MSDFRKGSAGWINKQIKEEELKEKGVTLKSLESQYKEFCHYAKDPIFHVNVFRTWGWRMYKHPLHSA